MSTKLYIRLVGILFLFLASYPVMGQRLAEKADRYFDKNLFEEAIKYYEQEVKSKKDRDAMNYARKQIAECYRIIGEFEEAEKAYAKILKKKSNQEDETNYLNYGKALKSSAKYDLAKVQFEKYIEMMPDDPMGPIFLQSCDSAQKWLEESLGEEVTNLAFLNTEDADFAPVYSKEGQLVFTSSRDGSTEAFISFNGGLEVKHLDFYEVNTAYMHQDSLVLIEENVSSLNSPFHEGSATFSADGNEIYFTRTVKGEKNSRTNDILNTIQIFYSSKDAAGIWSEPVSAFDFNSVNYNVGQPSLSHDGNTIFYISDKRSDSHGRTDIYYSTKESDGSWSEPINAGEDVNTFGYELFPYISKDGTLYFSSDSHPGMGQLDVFSAHFKNIGFNIPKRWTDVQNLKPPINSIGNDFGIVLDGQHQRGFFSSDRFNGVGAEDIYSFGEAVPLPLTLKGSQVEFPDSRIFDGLKYKLSEEGSETSTSLESAGGMFTLKPASGMNYSLIAKQGFFPYNTIEFRSKYNERGELMEMKITPDSYNVSVNGYYLEKVAGDSIHPNGTAKGGVKLHLYIGELKVEEVESNSFGYYQFSTPLDPQNTYYIRREE